MLVMTNKIDLMAHEWVATKSLIRHYLDSREVIELKSTFFFQELWNQVKPASFYIVVHVFVHVITFPSSLLCSDLEF